MDGGGAAAETVAGVETDASPWRSARTLGPERDAGGFGESHRHPGETRHGRPGNPDRRVENGAQVVECRIGRRRRNLSTGKLADLILVQYVEAAPDLRQG